MICCNCCPLQGVTLFHQPSTPACSHRVGRTTTPVWPRHENAGLVGWRKTHFAQGKEPGWKNRTGARRTTPRVERRCGERRNERWRKAQLAQGRGQPLNPTGRRRTHYAQGRLAQFGRLIWGWRKTQFAQGESCRATAVRGSGRRTQWNQRPRRQPTRRWKLRCNQERPVRCSQTTGAW